MWIHLAYKNEVEIWQVRLCELDKDGIRNNYLRNHLRINKDMPDG
jgi:hypothetical protein